MPVGRTTLGADEIVDAVHLVDVRAFDPDRFFGQIHAPIDDHPRLANRTGIRIEFAHPDGPMALVKRLVGGCVVIEDVGLSVIVKVDGWIDAIERKEGRLGPRSGRVGRGDEEVAPGIHQRRDHVKGALVVVNGRREHPARDAEAVEWQLGWAVEHVADLGPIDEVSRVVDRHAREVREAGVDQVVVAVDRDDRRVGVESCQDGVQVLIGPCSDRVIDRVTALVSEPVEFWCGVGHWSVGWVGCARGQHGCEERGEGEHVGFRSCVQDRLCEFVVVGESRAPVEELGGRYLRVIVLGDLRTIHNAFLDRSFMP